MNAGKYTFCNKAGDVVSVIEVTEASQEPSFSQVHPAPKLICAWSEDGHWKVACIQVFRERFGKTSSEQTANLMSLGHEVKSIEEVDLTKNEKQYFDAKIVV